MDPLFFLLILPFLIYWCINEKTGLQIGIVVLLCIWAIFLYRNFVEYLPFNFDLEWVIIAVIFCGYLFLRSRIESLLLKGGFRACMTVTAAVSFLMIIYRPELEFVLPGGLLLGLGIGYCLNRRFIGFKSMNVLERTGLAKYLTLLARFVLGMAVLVLFVFRIELIIEQISKSQNIFLYGFLCYALISMWVSVASPWVFIKLRLAGSSSGIEEKQ